MANNKKSKIDENGKLMQDYFVENSKFFDILVVNSIDELEEWLVNNGTIKSYCPIRFVK